MTSGTKISDWDATDGCPEHKGCDCRRVYDFGRGDAEITTFVGCRCAVAQQFDPCGILQYDAVYHTSYNAATGLARMSAAMNAATFG